MQMKLNKSSTGNTLYHTYKCVKQSFFLQKKMMGVVVRDNPQTMALPSKVEVTLTQLSFLLKECQDHLEIPLLRLGFHLFIPPLQNYLAKSYTSANILPAFLNS